MCVMCLDRKVFVVGCVVANLLDVFFVALGLDGLCVCMCEMYVSV